MFMQSAPTAYLFSLRSRIKIAAISELFIKFNGRKKGNPIVVTFPKSKFFYKIVTFGILDVTLKGIFIGF